MEAMNVQKERGRAIKETASSNGEMKVSHHILHFFFTCIICLLEPFYFIFFDKEAFYF
jgi:hypothetical protein